MNSTSYRKASRIHTKKIMFKLKVQYHPSKARRSQNSVWLDVPEVSRSRERSQSLQRSDSSWSSAVTPKSRLKSSFLIKRVQSHLRSLGDQLLVVPFKSQSVWGHIEPAWLLPLDSLCCILYQRKCWRMHNVSVLEKVKKNVTPWFRSAPRCYVFFPDPYHILPAGFMVIHPVSA